MYFLCLKILNNSEIYMAEQVASARFDIFRTRQVQKANMAKETNAGMNVHRNIPRK